MKSSVNSSQPGGALERDGILSPRWIRFPADGARCPPIHSRTSRSRSLTFGVRRGGFRTAGLTFRTARRAFGVAPLAFGVRPLNLGVGLLAFAVGPLRLGVARQRLANARQSLQFASRLSVNTITTNDLQS